MEPPLPHLLIWSEWGAGWCWLLLLVIFDMSRHGNADDEVCQHGHQSLTRSYPGSSQANLNHHTHHTVISHQTDNFKIKLNFSISSCSQLCDKVDITKYCSSDEPWEVFIFTPNFHLMFLWSSAQCPNSDPVSSFRSNNKHWSWSGEWWMDIGISLH